LIWILGAFYRLFEQVTMPGQAEVEWGGVWRNAQRLGASTNRKNFVVLVDVPARDINYLPGLLPNFPSINHLYLARTKQKTRTSFTAVRIHRLRPYHTNINFERKLSQ